MGYPVEGGVARVIAVLVEYLGGAVLPAKIDGGGSKPSLRNQGFTSRAGFIGLGRRDPDVRAEAQAAIRRSRIEDVGLPPIRVVACVVPAYVDRSIHGIHRKPLVE